MQRHRQVKCYTASAATVLSGSGSARGATGRVGPETRSGLIPVRPELVAAIRYFGRYRGGWIRDGVLLSVG